MEKYYVMTYLTENAMELMEQLLYTVHTGHTYSTYANVPENLIFLTPKYKQMYVHIGAGEGGGS